MFKYKDYVYNVYRESSFTKAAEKMFISQPSLSAAVKKAERAAGQDIFNRLTTPVTLTPFGVLYIECVKQIYEMEQSLNSCSAKINTLERGSLSIGAFNLGMKYFLPGLIVRFKKTYPGMIVRLIDGNTVNIKQKLDQGELDIIITNSPFNTNEYDVETCYHEHLLLVVPKEQEVNRQFENVCLNHDGRYSTSAKPLSLRRVSLRDFAGVPFILLNHGNYLRSCTDVMFQEAGITPKIAIEVEQSSLSYNLARYGLGATILSDIFFEENEPDDSLCIYNIDSPLAARKGFACFRKGANKTPAMKKFIEMIHQARQLEQ